MVRWEEKWIKNQEINEWTSWRVKPKRRLNAAKDADDDGDDDDNDDDDDDDEDIDNSIKKTDDGLASLRVFRHQLRPGNLLAYLSLSIVTQDA